MHSHAFLLAVLAVACAAVPAGAGDAAGVKTGLPGVTGGYAIVTPMPDPPSAPSPAEDPAAKNAGGRGMTFQAGNFEVTVTGSVAVEIGFGKRPPGGRR